MTELRQAIRDLFDRRSLIETALAVIVLGGLLYCVWHAIAFGYLPQPFFYDPYDTYADWFNTAYWARDEGTYDVWKTIYPPLSFVILRVLGLDHCYPQNRSFESSPGLVARDCDWLGMASIYVFFFATVALIYYVLRKNDRRTAIQRTICAGLGLPMIDCLERGNLAFVSFLFMLLAFFPILKSARLRWLAAGLAVNLKIYLVGAIVALLLKRRWRWVECALVSVVLVYLVSYALLGRGTPMIIFTNIRDFADFTATQLLDIWYTTTYQALISLLGGDEFPLALLIGSQNVDIALFVLTALQRAVQLAILVAAAAIWLRPEVVPTYRAINLAIIMALISAEAGGYSQIYFFIFVMMEPWKGFARKLAIVGCYVLAIPLDFPLDTTPEVARDLYLGDGRSLIAYQLMLGPFVRPLIILVVGAAISALTIREVWQDVRLQAWSSRWRFRRDAPMLPWIRRPAPPAAE